MTEHCEALAQAEEAFNEAMISNDVARIAECVTPNWVLVTPERGPVPGLEILKIIGTRMLAHATMTKTIHHMHVMGDVALVTARGQNTGHFRDIPISADEWITDVYHRLDLRWRYATHLTPAASER